MSTYEGGVTSKQALRLVLAYGLQDGALAPVLPVERPPYVPFCQDIGVRERTCTSDEMKAAMARLWAEGLSIKAIATTLHVSTTRVASVTCRCREMFPYRRGPYTNEVMKP